jgi:5-methyltetrahydrofolate--homocysteine methyltransferase
MKKNSFDPLIKFLLDGDHSQAVAAAKAMGAAGVKPEGIVTQGIEAAMARLDNKCTVEHFNLLEIMLAGRAVGAVIRELFPRGMPVDAYKHTFVIATLEGDVHELGKNIVRSVLAAKGYRVIDCGKDCPLERLVNTASREGVQAVLVSGLLTSVIPQVRQVRQALAAKGIAGLPVVAGGAVLKQAGPGDLNVDFVAQNVFEAARYLDQTIAGARP